MRSYILEQLAGAHQGQRVAYADVGTCAANGFATAGVVNGVPTSAFVNTGAISAAPSSLASGSNPTQAVTFTFHQGVTTWPEITLGGTHTQGPGTVQIDWSGGGTLSPGVPDNGSEQQFILWRFADGSGNFTGPFTEGGVGGSGFNSSLPFQLTQQGNCGFYGAMTSTASCTYGITYHNIPAPMQALVVILVYSMVPACLGCPNFGSIAQDYNAVPLAFNPGTVEQPPTARFTSAPAAGPRKISFDGRSSTAVSPRHIVSWAWDFNDGTSGTGSTVNHTFTANGTYQVKLTVIDDHGNTGSVTHAVDAKIPIVNSTGDDPDQTPGDGECYTGHLVQGGAKECTLRAAIQEADAGSSSTIQFDIPGSAPTITPQSQLPDITKAITIDGTSQPGGHVAVQGPGTGTPQNGLAVTAGGAKLLGLVLGGWHDGIHITGAGGDTVSNSILGLSPTGDGTTGNGWSNDNGVDIDGSPGNTVTGDTIGRSIVGDVTGAGVYIHGAGATGNHVTSSKIGTNTAGNADRGNELGVRVVDAGGNQIGPGNTIAANDYDVQVLATSGGSAAGNTVTSNLIGVGADGTSAPWTTQSKTGVVVTGGKATGTIISGNTIAGQETNVAAYKADGVTIADNRIGTNASGTAVATTLFSTTLGVVVDGTPHVTLSGNTIAGQRAFNVVVPASVTPSAILTTTGAGANLYSNAPFSNTPAGTDLTISNNNIGLLKAAALAAIPSKLTAKGIQVTGNAAQVTIENNTVGSQTGDGIEVIGGKTTTVSGNTIGPAPGGTFSAGSTNGLVVRGTNGLTVSGNTISGNSGTGVLVTGGRMPGQTSPTGTNTSITGNKIGVTLAGTAKLANGIGIQIDASTTNTHVGSNTISGNTTAGVVSAGTGLTLTSNRVGLAATGTAGIANNAGVLITAGDANLSGNTIANNPAGGVVVASAAHAKILANPIYHNDGKGIKAPGAPAAPTISAAIPQTVDGTAKLLVVVKNLPANTDTIEIFGNPDCTNPEGKVPLSEQSPKPGAAFLLASLANAGSYQGITATATVGDRTSQFSSCVAPGPATDTDGDGTPNVIEDLGPHGGDADQNGVPDAQQANVATFANAAGDLITLVAPPGSKLFDVGVGTKPAAAQPAGMSTPAGLITFALSVPAGTSAVVDVLVPDGEQGVAYWQYGPPTPGAASAWYAFNYDAATNTGAQAIPGGWALHLTDGGRGDDDSTVDGVIHDPGGPANGVPASSGTPAAVTPPATGPTSLAFTGVSTRPLTAFALMFLLLGLLLLFATRRRPVLLRTAGTVAAGYCPGSDSQRPRTRPPDQASRYDVQRLPLRGRCPFS